MGIKLLKLTFSTQTSHYWVPYTRDPRNTYPIAPYSTAIGLLANILGDQNAIDSMLKDEFALGILSSFTCLTSDYTWMRNMKRDRHKERFVHIENRNIQNQIEHPGGQSPVFIDVLNDVKTIIYFYHPRQDFINTIYENLYQPERWLSHLHLGRSEDWAVIDEKNSGLYNLDVSCKASHFKEACRFYQWMPHPDFTFGLEDYLDERRYDDLYQKIYSNVRLVTTMYKLVDVFYTDKKKTAEIRNFQHLQAKIFNSQIPMLSDFSLPMLFTDKKISCPVYLAKMSWANE